MLKGPFTSVVCFTWHKMIHCSVFRLFWFLVAPLCLLRLALKIQQHKSSENIHITRWPDVSWNAFKLLGNESKLALANKERRKKSQQTSRQRRQQLVQSKKNAQFFQQLGLAGVGSRSHRKWASFLESVSRPPHQGGLGTFIWPGFGAPEVHLPHSTCTKQPHRGGQWTLVRFIHTKWGWWESPQSFMSVSFIHFFFLTVNDVKSTNNQQESLLNTWHFTLSCNIFFSIESACPAVLLHNIFQVTQQ